MIVFLSELDTYEIAWAASGRCQFKKDAGIKKREIVWIKRIPELWKKVME
jgi:hypothetical protein